MLAVFRSAALNNYLSCKAIQDCGFSDRGFSPTGQKLRGIGRDPGSDGLGAHPGSSDFWLVTIARTQRRLVLRRDPGTCILTDSSDNGGADGP